MLTIACQSVKIGSKVEIEMRAVTAVLTAGFSLFLSFSSIGLADSCNCAGAKKKYVERYATLYVASDPPGAVITSTSDGQTLSDLGGTPTVVTFIKSKFPYSEQTIGLLTYKECFRPSFDRITINRWYRTPEEAKINPHQLRPTLVRILDCKPNPTS